MINDPHIDVFTIGIGGAAGDGVREAGQSLGTLLTSLGYEVFMSFTYPSLIKGGHNFSRLTFSKEKVWCDHTSLDVLIALNEETVKVHKNELGQNAVVFADSFEKEDIDSLKENAVALPMSESSKKLKALPITRNSVALGATCYLLDLHFGEMQKILNKVFKEKSLKANIELADIGFKLLESKNFRHSKTQINADSNADKRGFIGENPRSDQRQSAVLMDGNVAFAKGLLAAGLDFYVSYPMTPATSILHFLAKEQAGAKHRVIQPESELSAINMALGMSYAGKRVAVGSATGGFALMQEAFSFAGGAELPIVAAVSQRQAPATGVPTFSSQTDLRFAIHSGHGEFPKIVIAPGDPEEAFFAGAQALNLAWKYQLPAIVLMDKILSEHSSTSLIDKNSIRIEKGKISEKTGASYGRYQITEDGISPMAFPGTRETVVKVTSYEHDPAGITAEEATPVKAMIDKRFAKTESLKKELANQETVKIYGDKGSETAIVFWGSTKGPVLEAAKYLDKPVRLVQVLWVEPFDSAKVTEALKDAKKIINIECNHDAQMASLIKEKTGINVTDNILKYDSRPFEPVALAEEINNIIMQN
ncbi:MAG: 2-oxoacid:acceptor oxidoreductase subunit alpha [Candidatus Paceibacterota bacterium]